MTNKKFKFILFIIVILLGNYIANLSVAEAETSNTATLRIIATGDLHGQVTAFDYETGLKLPRNGLSKLATLEAQKEKEAGANNTLLVDAGDFLYDYSTNYFYDNYREEMQPILKAMSLMKYDYITLGNHEFDYPFDYLTNQLKGTGLADKVLVCNTVWHDSGKQVFSPSVITTKFLSTSDGSAIPVRIGIIGSTTNSLSARRGDYVNEIDALNNYNSIVAEAYRLKNEEKVAAVIVILHGGIGSDKAGIPDDNIGYSLTKVSTIDAVVTGHTHDAYPEAKELSTLNLPAGSFDIGKGTINGKPVVAASSHAGALGIIDLTFHVSSDDTVTISGGKAGIDYVTDSVEEDSRITAIFSDYQKKLEAGADLHTYTIAKGITYHNYDTVLQDSNLYQLLNNAKIDYGLTYIAENMPEYQNIPVIACTRNLTDTNAPYLLLKSALSSDKISQILSEASSTRPSGYIQMYEITGKALREWLEYNASMYATAGTVFKNLLKSYVSKNPGVSTLLQENYIYNWNSQYIFDGISYTVDLTKKARYSSAGYKLNSANKRIASLTYNGTAVTDTQKFILVTDRGIPALSFLPKEGEDSIKVIRDNETGKNLTLNYIKRQSAFGNINIKADYNWSLSAGNAYTFLLGVPKTISATVSAYTWSKGVAAETTSYSFLKGRLPQVSQTINIVAAQGRTEVNNEPVPIILSATAKTGIKEIKYLKGKILSITDSNWNNAFLVKNNTFETSNNGVYTIKVTDKSDKSAIAYITVDRYDAEILASPVLNKLTNRNTTVTGKAVPGSVLHITIGKDNYSSIVKSDGTFSLLIQPPKAFSEITAYVEATGKKSAIVTAGVRKTGPDAVQMDKVRVWDNYVTGTADPYTSVYALTWTTIYVGKGQTQAYKESDFYNPKYNIVETDITVDQITGAYKILIPVVKYNMKIFVFSINRFGETSKSTMLTPV